MHENDAGTSTTTDSSSGEDARVIALTRRVILEPNDPKRLAALCGAVDTNLKHLEKRLSVHIRNRGNEFQVSGPEPRVEAASALLHQLYRETNERETIEPDFVHLFLQEAGVENLLNATAEDAGEDGQGEVVIRTYKRPIKPRGGNQQSYVREIRNFDVNFGIGPAGTGKTYLAVACAVEALEAQRVSRILLVRPAVEAGEKLGFLPGDLAQKIDPYLRPLYDALYEMMGVERVNKFIERNIIEVAAAGLHARPHAQQRLHHPRREPEHDGGADEDVSHAHRLWLHRGHHRRYHADRPASRAALRAGECAQRPAQHRWRELHQLRVEGRGAASTRAAHRRRLRDRGGEPRRGG